MNLIFKFLNPLISLFFFISAIPAFATSTQFIQPKENRTQANQALFRYFQQQQSSIKNIQENIEVLRETVFNLAQENTLLKKQIEALKQQKSSTRQKDVEPYFTPTTNNQTPFIQPDYPPTHQIKTDPLPPPITTTGTKNIKLNMTLLGLENTQNNNLVTSSETALYDKAFQHLTQKELQKARTLFIQQVSLFPQGALTADALFWLGEIYFSQQDFQSALSFFQQLQKQFPNHTKQPETLYKSGFSLIKLERHQEGKKLLNRLVYAFPNASSARLAQKELSLLE